MMYILTPRELFCYKRLFIGETYCGNNFQPVLQETFEGRLKIMIKWMGDLLFFVMDGKYLLPQI